MEQGFFIDILDIEQTIKDYAIPEITTSTLYSSNSSEPHPDGLLSYRIFGNPGTPTRKYAYGYINLNSKFVHPKIYASLINFKREIFRDLINGVGNFTVEKGEVKRVVGVDNQLNVKKGEKVGTGIEFLYNIWDELDFKPRPDDAQQTKETRAFLSIITKKDVFVDKWLVIPAFYRDVDLGMNKRNEYNTFYIKLIELASVIKVNSVMFAMFSTSDAHKKIQTILNEIYNLFVIEKLGGTKGFIQNNVMGKTSDYAARMVISAANYNFKNASETEVSFTHSAIPLYVILKTFLPFVAYEIRKFFKNFIGPNNYIWVYDEQRKERTRHEIDPNYLEMLSIKNLQKRIEIYSKSRNHRLFPVTIKVTDRKDEIPLLFFNGERLLNSEEVYGESVIDLDSPENVKKFIRPFNWTELFYMISYEVCKNRVGYITRYPIESHNSMYPSFINIIPCAKYKSFNLNGKDYPRFPDFREFDNQDPRKIPITKLNAMFPDTLRLHPAYLSQLGADFDGLIDMINIISNNIKPYSIVI